MSSQDGYAYLWVVEKMYEDSWRSTEYVGMTRARAMDAITRAKEAMPESAFRVMEYRRVGVKWR